MRMLRALDLEDAQFIIRQKDITKIGLFCHLKYVRFPRDSYIYALPKSIQRLKGLQNLEIRNSHITALPTEISELHSLRSLRCSRQDSYDHFDIEHPMRCLRNTLHLPMLCTPLVDHDYRLEVTAELHKAYSSRLAKTEGVRVPRGIDKLTELHTLEVVDIKQTGKKAVKELAELIQLRKLSVVTGRFAEQKRKILYLCAAIEKLSSLCSLSVHARYDGTLEWLHKVSSPPPLLKTLKLYGDLEEMPEWVGSLKHLVRVYFGGSCINEDKIMEMLGKLPNLMVLNLRGKARDEKKLVFRAKSFQNLKKLWISFTSELREVRFQKGALPQMQNLEFSAVNLESGIIGIKHLPLLKQISLGYDGRVARLGMLQAEVDTHPNHPLLQLEQDHSEHDLGDVVQGPDVAEIEEEEEPSLLLETCTVGESSQSEVAAMPTTNIIGHDDLLYTYNSC